MVDRHHVGLPHKRWRQQGWLRTPAMAIGLAKHGGSYRADLWSPVHPEPLGCQLMQQRGKERLIPALETG